MLQYIKNVLALQILMVNVKIAPFVQGGLFMKISYFRHTYL
jgi:hypothetical protein